MKLILLTFSPATSLLSVAHDLAIDSLFCEVPVVYLF